MNHKRLTSNALICALLSILSVLSTLSGCGLSGRGPQSRKVIANDTLEVEIWTNHDDYNFVEPVKVRARLRNVTHKDVTLHSESGTIPVMDIIIQRGSYMDPTERWSWSEQHPDDVVYTLTLGPGQSYIIEWILVLSARSSYRVDLEYMDNVGNPSILTSGFSYAQPRH